MISKEPDDYMGICLRLAEEAFLDGEIPVGAIVVCEGRIIAKAYNQTEKLHDCTAHAEVLAITTACEALGSKYLSDCQLYVSLEPCTMCAGAIAWSQIGEIYYGAEDLKKGFFSNFDKTKIFSKKVKVKGGVKKMESSELLQRFFRKLR
ncbi:MAG: nucleoside deaminase [Cyclobacteriaceae bacterium]|nr:nucleoside deaminase [Cyclobacteriaceae bacterium]MCH8515499.1 nucleoside deaminase [Cyclobacteriaceae bacterium]